MTRHMRCSPPASLESQSCQRAGGLAGAGGTGDAAAGGAALSNGVPANVSNRDGGADSPGASASNPLAALLGYRCAPEHGFQSMFCRRDSAWQHVPALPLHCDCRLAMVTRPAAAGSSNDEESGSESGEADEREPTQPNSPNGRAASAAGSDGMDAEVRVRGPCFGRLDLWPARQFG